MTILTITRKGTLRLPNAIIQHLQSAKHLQVRLNAHGLTLTPVNIRSLANHKAIPGIDTPTAQPQPAAETRPDKSPRQK